MKAVLFCLLIVLGLSSFTLPTGISAQGDGPSVSGSYQVSMENGQSRDIEFHARSARDGNTTGEITLRDTGDATVSKSSAPSTDEESTPTEALPPFYAKAICDCLVVKGIEAALSGTITEASQKSYIGRRVVLVVQDGDSITPPLKDKLTYGVYKITKKDWSATDSERDDDGPAPNWVATDAERSDDTGVLSVKSDEINCQSFPISAHSFLGSKVGKGKIQVQR
ncbi:MAG: hypothetical protein AABN95_16710 [Acidobacteriota bacterium]